jgi:hypothetical protein
MGWDEKDGCCYTLESKGYAHGAPRAEGIKGGRDLVDRRWIDYDDGCRWLMAVWSDDLRSVVVRASRDLDPCDDGSMASLGTRGSLSISGGSISRSRRPRGSRARDVNLIPPHS